jgi:hypothetical protein
MKRYIIFIMAFLLVIAPNKAGATFKEYDIVAKSSKEKINLYAKKMDGLYQDFKIHFYIVIYLLANYISKRETWAKID